MIFSVCFCCVYFYCSYFFIYFIYYFFFFFYILFLNILYYVLFVLYIYSYFSLFAKYFTCIMYFRQQFYSFSDSELEIERKNIILQRQNRNTLQCHKLK